ncbi:hypothetical protein V8E53_014372 [Lactarius tabidus]
MFDPNNHCDISKDIEMSDIIPVIPNVDVPNLLPELLGGQNTVPHVEQRDLDVRGSTETKASDSHQSNRAEVRASVRAPGQPTEVLYEPEQATENAGTQDNGQVDAEGLKPLETPESEVGVASPVELEEPQQQDALQCISEPPAIEHPELEQNTDPEQIPPWRTEAASRELNIAAESRATDNRNSLSINESAENWWSSEPGSTALTVFGTVDDRVTAIKEKYQTMNDQTVQEWCKTTLETQKQALSKSHQALRNFCELELNKLEPMSTAPALVEFGTVNVQVCVSHSPQTLREYLMNGADIQTNCHCSDAEANEAIILLGILAEISDKLCADFPTFCDQLAHKSEEPLTENVIVNADDLTFQSYKCLSQNTVIKVDCKKKTIQKAQEVIQKLAESQIPKPWQKSGARDRNKGEHEKLTANKQHDAPDQAIPEQEGPPAQQQTAEMTSQELTLSEIPSHSVAWQQQGQEEAQEQMSKARVGAAAAPDIYQKLMLQLQTLSQQQHQLQLEEAANQEHKTLTWQQQDQEEVQQQHQVMSLAMLLTEQQREQDEALCAFEHRQWEQQNAAVESMHSKVANLEREPVREQEAPDLELQIMPAAAPASTSSWPLLSGLTSEQQQLEAANEQHKGLAQQQLQTQQTFEDVIMRRDPHFSIVLNREILMSMESHQVCCRCLMIEEASLPQACKHRIQWRAIRSARGLCQEHFSAISTIMEQHTKLVELIASRVMHLQHKTATSSTCREDLDSDKSTPAPRRVGHKFRAPAKKTIHKDDKELCDREGVCKHMNMMMGRLHCSNMPPESAPEVAVLKYNRTCNDKDGPSKDQFRADLFTTPYTTNQPLQDDGWNNIFTAYQD